MNALAAMCWERRPTAGVDLCTGVNAYDAAEIRAGENVVVVGAFVPFLKSLKRTHHRFTVLELDSATLKLDELPHFRPANEAASVVPDADVVLITGTTLLNNTLENLLALCQPKARVVLVGPTVGLLPDAFLRRGVDVLGGVRVTAPDAFLDVLMEGGSTYHFFGRSAEKVVLMPPGRDAQDREWRGGASAVMRRSAAFCSIAPSSVTVAAGRASGRRAVIRKAKFTSRLHVRRGAAPTHPKARLGQAQR